MEVFRETRELIESVLGNLLLKSVPSSMLSPDTEEDEHDLKKKLNQIDERFSNLSKLAENHCVLRTYFFHVKK